MANTKRNKGHSAERLYAQVFKDLGFSHCQTSRYGSRQSDDCGIDLINLPINVQIKAGYKRGLKPKDEILYVKNKVSEIFPSGALEHTKPTILIHRQDVGRGKKRTEVDDIVSMTFEDFVKIIKKIKKWD